MTDDEAVDRGESGNLPFPASRKKLSPGLLATLSSTALWVLSLILAFTIHPGEPLIWLPDALLLLGFVPLLLLWHRWWLTLLFGLFNGGIGFFLLLLACFKLSDFPAETRSVIGPGIEHLVGYHSCWTWMVLGVLSTAVGLVHLLVKICRFLLSKCRS